jgi:hypothetical protein
MQSGMAVPQSWPVHAAFRGRDEECRYTLVVYYLVAFHISSAVLLSSFFVTAQYVSGVGSECSLVSHLLYGLSLLASVLSVHSGDASHFNNWAFTLLAVYGVSTFRIEQV